MPKRFPFFPQFDSMDCGPTCLRMIAAYYGKHYSLQFLRDKCYIDKEGVSLQGITEAAESLGFRTLSIKLPFESSDKEQATFEKLPLPCIVHWRKRHFNVVYKYSRKNVWVADPGAGKFKLNHDQFKKHWLSDEEKGIALVMEPTPEFFKKEPPAQLKTDWRFLGMYLQPYNRYFVQLGIGLVLSIVFQLIFPFLTQAIVDLGIKNQDINFIYLILIAQITLFMGQTAVTVIQNWILLHIGTRINVSLLSDFLKKLMQLPIQFFNSKMIGDLYQRISDQQRIELFLTNSALRFLLSSATLLVFSMVLWFYSLQIFLAFVLSSIIYLLWIVRFLRKRKEVDYIRFQELSNHQGNLVELLFGMQEIKLQNSARKHRWLWSDIQARVFDINMKSLSITQKQDAGASFISQFKDIYITFSAATLVIEGQITLGTMLAIQFIVGQLNVPLQQMIQFVRGFQDAKISLDRILEIQNMPGEEEELGGLMVELPETGDLVLEKVSFQYNPLSDYVLRDIDLVIPRGKVTAIVGASGSGKTTLIKLLLGFFAPTSGNIKLGYLNLVQIEKKFWREHCGAVMQDGYIFSQTIAENIAESDDRVDREKLLKSVKVANIQAFIESLPLRYNTVIGPRGNGVSQGQRQRILIARAIYKDPEFMFFDEATNALDANNERIIIENLQKVFENRTVVVVAHRLSTVKNADQIVVLEKGTVIERGDHETLISKKGAYYKLIKNQLELGT